MPNWVQIINGEITQRAVGFTEPPFEDAIEAPVEAITDPDDWKYLDGTWTFDPIPKPESPVAMPTAEERIAALEAAMPAIMGV